MASGDNAQIGVVVAAFNAQVWIGATLDSLLAQQFQDWVCVVIDDGSTDATAQIVGQFSAREDRVRLVSQPNAGLAAARNAGIAALPQTCEYVAFLDSDDLYQPDTLQALLTALAPRPDAVGAYGLADYIDEQSRVTHPGLHPSRQRYRHRITGFRLRHLHPSEDFTFATAVVAGPIWPTAVALQRLSAVRAVGGFDCSFTSQEDWELYLRLSRLGPYAVVDRVLVGYRRHGSNVTNSPQLSFFHQQRVRRNAYLSPDNTADQKRQVSRAWRYLTARQVAVLLKHAGRSITRGGWRDASHSVIGAVWCTVELVRPGPPPPSLHRARYTQPARLPGNLLIPEVH